MVEVDVTCDEVAEKRLFKFGMMALRKNRQAVIAYAIQEAVKEIAKS